MQQYKPFIYKLLKEHGYPLHYKFISQKIIEYFNINPMTYYKSSNSRFEENLRNMLFDDPTLILICDQKIDIQGTNKGGTGYFFFLQSYDGSQTTLVDSGIPKRDYQEDFEMIKDGKLK